MDEKTKDLLVRAVIAFPDGFSWWRHNGRHRIEPEKAGDDWADFGVEGDSLDEALTALLTRAA